MTKYMLGLPQIAVLAVDDEPLVLDFIVSDLEDNGYAVRQARSAQEALAILYDAASELGGLITDINLGRGKPTGWDVARRARELNPNLPVVYVTGDSSHEWMAQGVPRSALLPKPFAPADLIVALAELRKID